MNVPNFEKCPRCNDFGYEVLSTHACCVLCGYEPETYSDNYYIEIPEWAIHDAFKEVA